MSYDNGVTLVLAILLTGYLLLTLVFPERF